MPTIQIYLNQELFDFVKNNKSKIIQQALKEYKKQHALKKTLLPPNDDTDFPA